MATARLLDLAEDQYRAGLVWREALGHQLLDLTPSDELSGASKTSLALEPMMFAHFAANEPARFLAQIAFGHQPQTGRPIAIPVRTNNRGTICLSGLGRLTTAYPNTELTLQGRGDASALQIWGRNGPIEADLHARTVVNGTIEVDLEAHPALQTLWPATGSPEPPLAALERYVEPLAHAFRILNHAVPQFARMIVAVTRRIVLMSDRDAHSFAADAAYGAAFFNIVDEEANELFFIEEIAHQCGHILFSAITYEPGAFLRIPMETQLAEATDAVHDGRSLYEALHGAFTEATMALCFDACLERRLFEGRDRHELLGRVALILRKMNHDLLLLARPDFYTERGAAWFDTIRLLFEELCDRRWNELRGFDFAGQPYAFDYRAFAARNPLAE